MRMVRGVLMGAALGLPLLTIAPAHAQQNDFGSDVRHFFQGMTPNGSMRQAYEAGRHDEYAALMGQRDRWCSSRGYSYNTQPYGYPNGPYANR